MSLEKFLTVDEPLGPIRHERILKRHTEDSSSQDPINILIYKVTPFDSALESLNPIVLGRRGAGKTAIIAAKLSNTGHYYYTRTPPHKDRHDLVVFIQSWDHLDEIVNLVGLDCLHSLGNQPLWDELLPETAARHWERHIWETIFKQIYRNSFSDNAAYEYREELPLVFKFIEGNDVIPPDLRISDSQVQNLFENTRDSVIKFLTDYDKKCYVVIDSLDLYPVSAPRFSRIISGFLRCITNMSDNDNQVNLYCCIPEEVEPFLAEHTSNELRDLSPLNSFSRIHWRPSDLLKIVAERYRSFLKIHFKVQTNEDRDFLKKLVDFNFSERSDMMNFFGMVMPKHITNRYGKKENSIAYIVRHTQLLPREFILIFSQAMKLSYLDRRSWSYITADSIVKSVSELELTLSRQILKPYRPMYGNLIKKAKALLPELPPICKLSDLDKVGKRFSAEAVAEADNPWEILFQMGVIGFIRPPEVNDNNNNEHYELGSFHFNSDANIAFANHIRYCVHPIFSGAWHLNRTNEMKFVYPRKIEHNFWNN